jgi:hypothetical protein
MSRCTCLLVLAVCLAACSTHTAVTAPAPTATTPPALPHSMKGYELYSWQADGAWHFTLITGTNRLKSLEEITTGEDMVSTDGWVRVHVRGVEALKDLLCRLPAGEQVFWIGAQWLEGALADAGGLALPPQETIHEVEESCERQGVVLRVSE